MVCGEKQLILKIMESLAIIGEFILAVIKGILISPIFAVALIFILMILIACGMLIYLIFTVAFRGFDALNDYDHSCENNCTCKRK